MNLEVHILLDISKICTGKHTARLTMSADIGSFGEGETSNNVDDDTSAHSFVNEFVSAIDWSTIFCSYTMPHPSSTLAKRSYWNRTEYRKCARSEAEMKTSKYKDKGNISLCSINH